MESDSTKDGRFSYREIFAYLTESKYPSGFSKADKSALRKRAKIFEARGCDVYYVGQGKNADTVPV